MLAFLPADIGDILEHVLAPDERLRTRIAKSHITRRGDDGRRRLKWTARIASGYLRPDRIGQIFRQQELPEFCKTESILGDHAGVEHAVVSKHAILSADSIRAGEAVFIATDSRVERVGNM
ncbi:MAG TPA: hypothetical protein VGL53_04475 [Bryobacteraceae bacterium]|jgi:hypothetical protein